MAFVRSDEAKSWLRVKISSAYDRVVRPASVSSSLRPAGLNKATPRSSSRILIWALMVCGVRCSCLAVVAMLPERAVAQK